MSLLPQPWLSYRRQCSQTPKYQYITALPLTLATTSFLPCDKRTKWPPWTKKPITHQHRANVTKVSSWLTDKDSQPPVYQVGLGQRVYILPGALWATLGQLPPIPQHPRTPGHKAFRLQLTANELGGIRFAGLGPKWSIVQPRSARANPLWQPRALGLWGRLSSHKNPTPIGDAGCPWEWPPTDATPRDITQEGLPLPSPNKSGVISVIHRSWNASHLAFLKFHFGTLSATGWSDVFAVIMMGWWSLPYLSDEISHTTSMFSDGWHKERSSKDLVWW